MRQVPPRNLPVRLLLDALPVLLTTGRASDHVAHIRQIRPVVVRSWNPSNFFELPRSNPLPALHVTVLLVRIQ